MSMERTHKSKERQQDKMIKQPGYPIQFRFMQKIAIIACILSLFYFFVLLPEYVTNRKIETEVHSVETRDIKDAEQGQSATKKILAWTKLFNKDFLIYHKRHMISSDDAFAACPVYKNCEWTVERSAVETADAVVFHFFPKDFSLKDLPPYRAPHQKWIHMNLEAPIRFQGT